MNPRKEELRLRDIHLSLIAIFKIRNLLIKYPSEELLTIVAGDAINYQLIVLGEAITGLSYEYKDKHPEIDWREIVNLRNHLAHQYFQVDADSIETMIEERLRDLFQLVNLIFE